MSHFPRRERDFFGHDPRKSGKSIFLEGGEILTQEEWEEEQGRLFEAYERNLPEVSRVVVGVQERRERCQ